MTKIIDTPETVADMIALLQTLPADARLHCYVVGDGRAQSETPSFKIKVDDYPDAAILTFSNGYAISRD